MLIIFDCDGVLVDSEHLACLVDAEYLAELGIPLSADDVAERFIGRSMKDMLAELRSEFGALAPDHFPDEIRRRVTARFARELKAIAGVRAAIESLPQPRCVASSSGLERIRSSLTFAGLIDLFEGRLYSSNMVARGKPAPDIFLHAAREMAVAPERCIVIEDSVVGATGAVAAGARVIGFSGGTHVRDKVAHAEKLRAVGVGVVIDDMRRLRDTIERFSLAAPGA